MDIILSPQRRDDFIIVSKQGEALIINGDVLDFAKLLPEDGELPLDVDGTEVAPPAHELVPRAKRSDGKLTIVLILPHGPNLDDDEGWPKPIIDADDGVLIDQPARAQVKVDAAADELTKGVPIELEKAVRTAIYAGFAARTEAGMTPYRANAEMLAIIREWKATGKLTIVL